MTRDDRVMVVGTEEHMVVSGEDQETGVAVFAFQKPLADLLGVQPYVWETIGNIRRDMSRAESLNQGAEDEEGSAE